MLSDGWTAAHEAAAIAGGSWRKKVRFWATAVLLEHPSHGPVLFDTGYSSRFFSETARWPMRLYRLFTPVTLTEPRGLVELLRQRGIAASQVKHIIISHWHADHIGGLRDFPAAMLHTHRVAWDSVQGLRGVAALRKAFLPGLIPDDAASRLRWLREGDDVFGDGSLTVLELPGHATGQIGIRFTDERGQAVLLAADACWLSVAFREMRMPHPITRIIHDWASYRQSLVRLHELHRAEPRLLIVPCHCPETAARIAVPHS
ncbi:MAG: MBL fold metallo-hydrolase [Chthoniobacter sp.]|nr:MBL fold metallo-hydrolase [Chthoniobacter sp.]